MAMDLSFKHITSALAIIPDTTTISRPAQPFTVPPAFRFLDLPVEIQITILRHIFQKNFYAHFGALRMATKLKAIKCKRKGFRTAAALEAFWTPNTYRQALTALAANFSGTVFCYMDLTWYDTVVEPPESYHDFEVFMEAFFQQSSIILSAFATILKLDFTSFYVYDEGPLYEFGCCNWQDFGSAFSGPWLRSLLQVKYEIRVHHTFYMFIQPSDKEAFLGIGKDEALLNWLRVSLPMLSVETSESILNGKGQPITFEIRVNSLESFSTGTAVEETFHAAVSFVFQNPRSISLRKKKWWERVVGGQASENQRRRFLVHADVDEEWFGHI